MTAVENSTLMRLKVADRLPTPKGVALEVINLTQREDVSNHEIARMVSADPALSARVLKAANVLLSNPSRPIATVTDAVTVLGARALRQLVLGIALIVDYRNGPCKQFDYQHFWAHSLLTGIAAKHLVARARLGVPEEIFVLGLLGSIGRLALATAFPDEYGKLMARVGEMPLDELHRQEQDQLGCDEAELSSAILADMSFPKVFQTLAHDYLLPENSSLVEGSREWRLMHLLHVASQLADACLSSPDERGRLVAKLRLSAARVRGGRSVGRDRRCLHTGLAGLAGAAGHEDGAYPAVLGDAEPARCAGRGGRCAAMDRCRPRSLQDARAGG
jgi:HD-like signal output (HDOD) protein